MITKLSGYKNGYQFDENTTNEEFKATVREHGKFRSLICNSNTVKHFGTTLLGENHITINNKVPDDCFFINNLS